MSAETRLPLVILEFIRKIDKDLPRNLPARVKKIRTLVKEAFPLELSEYPPFLEIPYDISSVPLSDHSVDAVLQRMYANEYSSHLSKIRQVVLFPRDNICHSENCGGRTMMIHQNPTEPTVYTLTGLKTVLNYKTTCKKCKSKRSYFQDNRDFVDIADLDWIYITSSTIVEKRLVHQWFMWFLSARVSFTAVASVYSVLCGVPLSRKLAQKTVFTYLILIWSSQAGFRVPFSDEAVQDMIPQLSDFIQNTLMPETIRAHWCEDCLGSGVIHIDGNEKHRRKACRATASGEVSFVRGKPVKYEHVLERCLNPCNNRSVLLSALKSQTKPIRPFGYPYGILPVESGMDELPKRAGEIRNPSSS